MLRRTMRAGALLAALTLTLSACDLTVRIGADVEPDGSGVFGLEIELDQELVRGLQETAQATGQDTSSIATLEALFDALEEQGWETARATPKGGLLLSASRPFTDQAGFEQALDELAGAGGDESQPVDLGSLDLDYDVSRSFLRTETRFAGAIDLRFGEDVDPIVEQLSDVLADAVHFEIIARLPGGATVQEGGGTVEGDTVVWRPRIGSATTFAADSTQLRTGSLLLVVIPALVILALIGWLLMGRRPRHDEALEPEAITREQPAVRVEVHPNGSHAAQEHAGEDEGVAEPGR